MSIDKPANGHAPGTTTMNAAVEESNGRNLPDEQATARFSDLLAISREALAIRPPLWISSVFGLPWTWLPPHGHFSEFRIIDPWRLGRTIKYLINVTVPSIPRTPPPFGPPLIKKLFWQPSVILQRPDHNGNYTTFPDESWLFLNGIMTDDSLAQVNAAYISYLFHRPLTLIQNSTDSFFVDMLQCMLGKEWTHVTEPVIKAFPVIYDALKNRDKHKVVVIAHSQGTIIIANVLRLLYELTTVPHVKALEVLEAAPEFAQPEFVYPDQTPLDLRDFEPLDVQELAKLEVYCFATCANVLTFYEAARGERPLPWIEHFGNEYDIVARLGMLAPSQESLEIEIEGPRYVRPGAWGHFLNEHYLFAIEDEQKNGRKRGGRGTAAPFVLFNEGVPHTDDGQSPRLYHYINGGSPLT